MLVIAFELHQSICLRVTRLLLPGQVGVREYLNLLSSSVELIVRDLGVLRRPDFVRPFLSLSGPAFLHLLMLIGGHVDGLTLIRG
jgi:hypothetical protein